MNDERLKHGRAVAMGTLGGAKANCSLVALIAAVQDMTLAAAKGESFEWSDSALLAIADIDSEMERAATDRARLATAVARANDIENKYRAESLRCNELQQRNDNQAATITAFEQRHAEAVSAGAQIDRELTECRVQLAEWHAEARIATEALHKANADRQGMELQRNDAIDRADKLAAQLSRLMVALGGLTLAKLPSAALAAAYVDIREGR